MNRAGIILAAGKGTRMKSDLPKGLHAVCGVPMLDLILGAFRSTDVSKLILVVGFGADMVRERYVDCEFAEQTEQLGTGHAVQMASHLIEGFEGTVVVSPGDTPLLTATALQQLCQAHESHQAAVTVGTFIPENPKGYGRVVRAASGVPLRIVEERDATDSERAIREVNSAVYCFDAKVLLKYLSKLDDSNAQGEYYLPDILSLAANDGEKTHAVCFEDPEVFRGINDRWQLAEASVELNRRSLRRLAESGITIYDPNSTFIGPFVQVGHDTIIYPNTMIEGHTIIGERCEIGPNTKIMNCTIGDEVEVVMSHLNRAKMDRGTRCGPFANLRPHAWVQTGAKIGNFVEVKNATLGENVAVSHLSYIGDATIGAGSNIGAGTITCNYDGYRKHQTEIGENAFIGSNSTLVAPITIGNGSFVAAGSVVTRNVAPDALVIGRAAQVEKEHWAIHWRKKNEEASK